MVSAASFIALFPGGGPVVKRLPSTALSFGVTMLVAASLFIGPSRLSAAEQQPPQTTEGLLASTEQMIEHLILQLDGRKEPTLEDGEIADNPNPTSFYSSIPNIKPVAGAVSSSFGSRFHPIYKVNLFHAGIDFASSEGSQVMTTGDGIVAFSGYDKGYGQKVIINHGFGYKTVYAHLSKTIVRQGQKVKRGEVIALSGNTGLSTGPHLHYEVHKDNTIVNPTAYFFDTAHPDKFITTEKVSPEKRGNHS
ncbi:MAG: M23 family metallopeptidase [Chlorobiaceae bacterium]